MVSGAGGGAGAGAGVGAGAGAGAGAAQAARIVELSNSVIARLVISNFFNSSSS